MAHRLSPQAEAELDDIWHYIATASSSLDIADHFIQALTTRFFLLASHPHLGRRRDDDLRLGIRSFPVGKYIILYSAANDDVTILHVMRGSRDLQALLRN